MADDLPDGAEEVDPSTLTGKYMIIPVGSDGKADESKGREATLIRGKEVRLGDDGSKRRR
jgi:hypothetical protein